MKTSFYEPELPEKTILTKLVYEFSVYTSSDKICLLQKAAFVLVDLQS